VSIIEPLHALVTMPKSTDINTTNINPTEINMFHLHLITPHLYLGPPCLHSRPPHLHRMGSEPPDGEKVHSHGNKFEPQQLIQRVTGSKIDPAPYMRYLEQKYRAIYNF